MYSYSIYRIAGLISNHDEYDMITTATGLSILTQRTYPNTGDNILHTG